MTAEWFALMHRTRPAILGFIAGYVDGCTFVALFGLFVAQVTGSFSIAGAMLVEPEHGVLIKFLAVPAFLLGAAIATAVVAVADRTGWRASPIVLGIESLLLAGLLAIGLLVPDMSGPDHPAALVAGLLGLCAMGVQSGFVRLLLRGVPSTNVMTTNVTNLAIDTTVLLLGRLCGGTSPSAAFPTPDDIGGARIRLAVLLPIMLAFLLGTIAGAVVSHVVGFVSLLAPVAMLALLALTTPLRDPAR
jgi:uncharacterized membrane protein YoaK (UPF0700 family)